MGRFKTSHKLMSIKMGKEISFFSCKRKKSLSESEAIALGATYNQRHYLCPRCGNFHLTKNK